jgi:CTP synthase (UTP-ammonia lyase)
MGLRLALIGDYDPSVTAHRAIPRAIALAAESTQVLVEPEWVHTSKLHDLSMLSGAEGIWCVPASPYASTAGALSAIRHARERSIPFLGTCGGFQHALLEVADALWGIQHPAHAELEPHRPEPVIALLQCSLVEETGELRFAPGSRIARAYGCTEATEGYHCRYGLNPLYHDNLADGPLHATAWDLSGDVRGVELDGHPFFVATLFQPERQALHGRVPPLVTSLLQAMAGDQA